MALTEKELLDKKKEVEEAKDSLNSLKGEKKVYEKQLKDDWKCNSLDEVKTKLKSMKEKQQKLEEKIEDSLEELEDKYFNTSEDE